MSKRIDQLTPLTTAQVDDNTRLEMLGDPATGTLGKATVAQRKLSLQTQTVKYICTGTEGTTIAPPAVAARRIIGLFREGSFFYQVASAPDQGEYTFDSTNIVFNVAVNAGERILIQYCNA